ncbi:hypothetical protein [Paenibacillus popilliae]|uniref:Periplasmic component n=1 Tax=Paenibacillus popilliae ATCC 14706 TaxID=1212764 RepID=M9LS28_PAEPP|nr:hypothetical protein [Paenibacillus popilliae]GAC44486.1 periplasmic component [Paenibacillus popilliae ATCC 14706]
MIFILETESLLSNPILSKAYTEKAGPYAGMSRIVIKRIRIYFEQLDNDVLIVAVLFPGEKIKMMAGRKSTSIVGLSGINARLKIVQGKPRDEDGW